MLEFTNDTYQYNIIDNTIYLFTVKTERHRDAISLEVYHYGMYVI